MDCVNKSTHTIETTYGTYYVCQECIDNHPLPNQFWGIASIGYIKHSPFDAKKCMCEHISHFEND